MSDELKKAASEYQAHLKTAGVRKGFIEEYQRGAGDAAEDAQRFSEQSGPFDAEKEGSETLAYAKKRLVALMPKLDRGSGRSDPFQYGELLDALDRLAFALGYRDKMSDL